MFSLNKSMTLAALLSVSCSLFCQVTASPVYKQDYSGQTLFSVGSVRGAYAPDSRDIPKVVGIGLDLSLTYGTASLALEDGSYKDVAFVHGNQEYRDLYERLVTKSTHNSQITEDEKLTVSPCSARTMMESKLGEARQVLRHMLGLAPTSDIAVLSGMLTMLRKKVEAHLGHRITEAIPTWPRLANLSRIDLHDAMQHSGLNIPASLDYSALQDESTAAFARYRLGFCTSREPNTTCTRQPRNVLTLYFSDIYLHTMHQKLTEAQDDPSTEAGELGDWLMGPGMGLDSRSSYAGGETAYWNLLSEWMHSYFRFWARKQPLTDIVLLGEAADNANFTNIVLSARAQLPPSQMPFLNDESPLFDSARGAADLHAAMREERRPFEDDSNAAHK
ncbi:hypothetical protein BDZ85DRAFT_109699 [Elsinoe ampelina]|uniref:Uncharacterized protein n=1 Tax=Elsinoe ampelina TaxID=302913 RepID=A0A6A6GCQ5_9PEZI|nr:hypothetical protein BDZ85DRAFT_109699 [Elsinoe ampelina]